MSKRRKNGIGFNAEIKSVEEQKDIPVVPSQGEQQNPDTPAEEPKKGLFSKIGSGVATVGKKAIPVAVKVGKTIAFGGIVAGAYLLGKKASGGNDADEDIVEDDSVEEESEE